MTSASKVTLHMVASIDGFVAKEDGDVAWLETADSFEGGAAPDSGEDFMRDMKATGCFVIGSRTYEHALKLGWCYGDVPTFVLTSRGLSENRDTVHFRSGDLSQLVEDELRAKYDEIWVCGGPAVVRDFIRLGLADELIMTIAPVMIGDGLRFFNGIGTESALHLKRVTPYKPASWNLAMRSGHSLQSDT